MEFVKNPPKAQLSTSACYSCTRYTQSARGVNCCTEEKTPQGAFPCQIKCLALPHNELTILVTGGAGFIGSHTCIELLGQNYNVVIVDDISNSSKIAVERIRELSGADENQLAFYECNILDREGLETVFSKHAIDAIIHFAGFKAVGESTQKPLEYYWNNVAGSLVLFDIARNTE